ncbi:MAG: prepilin-type N-terminal cleavage/methylation domain-containing protein [Planctomycetota bacterium]|nr:MAG: prepilin-type N-terminal cleavage/methylation domain-containing protein [Planctomycetota bacterium]
MGKTLTRPSGPEAGGEIGKRRAGFSMVELMVTLCVLSVGMLAFARASVQSTRAIDASARKAIALSAARGKIEELKGLPFAQVFARYNDTGADDPGGADTAPGAFFDVDGLEAATDDADGFVGGIEFPVVDGAPGALREDLALPEFGLPADLSGDLLITSADHAADYRLLPIIVRLAWRGSSGIERIELRTSLGGL